MWEGNMDLQKKCLILELTLLAFCELSATMGFCRFARMFPNQGKTPCSKDNTSKEGKDVQVSCDTNHLPYVSNGSFHSKVSLGDACNLTCEVGFYPASSDQAVCEAGMVGGHRGNWCQGNFACNVATWDRNDLPDVLDGSFDCTGSTDLLIGDVCNLTCSLGFFPTSTNQTVCEPGVTGNQNGKWSEGNFSCQGCSDLLDGRIYQFVLHEMSVSNVTENCQSLNSSLVFIESEEEDNFVHQLVLKCAPDKGEWKGWTWTRNTVDGSGYDNWDVGEPNAGTTLCARQECVGMKYDSGKWHDHCCNRKFYSVYKTNI